VRNNLVKLICDLADPAAWVTADAGQQRSTVACSKSPCRSQAPHRQLSKHDLRHLFAPVRRKLCSGCSGAIVQDVWQKAQPEGRRCRLRLVALGVLMAAREKTSGWRQPNEGLTCTTGRPPNRLIALMTTLFFSRLIALNTSIENLTVRDPTTNLSTKQPTET
jgi:hypothetical protein